MNTNNFRYESIIVDIEIHIRASPTAPRLCGYSAARREIRRSPSAKRQATNTQNMVAILNQPPPKPLRGWISTFKVRHNGKKHGPYHVRCFKVGRKVHKQYIKPKELDYYLAATQAYRDRRKMWIAGGIKYGNFLANHKYLWRMMKRLEKGPIEQEHADHIVRIHKHGCHVWGRPPLRKKRFMDPFLTKLWNQCFLEGMAFKPILRGTQLRVPLEEIRIDLRESYDRRIEEQQMKAVHDAFWHNINNLGLLVTDDRGR
jgi:hypothetical protein